MWYILSDPEVHKKLQQELDGANLSFPTQYKQTRDLPYLNACIKEVCDTAFPACPPNTDTNPLQNRDSACILSSVAFSNESSQLKA